MRLRTFTAADMPSAMKLVRQAMGDNAIILSSESDGVKGLLTITAAVENEREEIAPRAVVHQVRNDPAADQLRYDIQNLLRFHNMPELFVAKLMQRASDEELAAIVALGGASARGAERLLEMALARLSETFFSFDPLPLDKPARIMLVGPPGIGKTLTIAKLAARFTVDRQPVGVITTDTKRAGGVEQLQAFTNILGLPLEVAGSPEELARIAGGPKARARLLIDTAGCNPYDKDEMAELTAFASSGGAEPVLVMQAGGDSLEAVDIAEAFCTLPIRRLLVTRADTARRFGGVLAASAAHGLAFSHASGSSSIADAPGAMSALSLAQLLLRYQLQSRST